MAKKGFQKGKYSSKEIDSFLNPYRITDGKKFSLKDINPGDTHGIGSESKDEAKERLTKGIERLSELQDKLYADDHWGLLLIFQAMDAAGKDGTIKHVLSGVNPQGCEVYSFKQPSAQELDHDYMWRYVRSLPQRGKIGIFNRSYYEEVLVVRVHQQILDNQMIPSKLISKTIWKDRLDDMRNLETYLTRNGILVLKFYLHLSRNEQKKRFLARLDRPEKNWKFSEADLKERAHWNSYMKAYEEAIKGTATPESPWYVVPADNKWFTRLVVGAAIVETLEKLNLEYPKVDKVKGAELLVARQKLTGSKE